MPKDAKGHGSNKRGAPSINAAINGVTKPLKVKSSVLDTIRQNPGGFSVTPKGKTPTNGFMVSVPGRTRIISESDLKGPNGARIIQDYAQQHSDILRQPGAHIGGWTDHASGKTYLDVSQNIKDQDKAISTGKAHNQIAIWDVKNSKEIRTGGTGE
jgi:hypothetical protein